MLEFYLGSISILGVLFTIYDKFASKYRRRKRVSEAELFFLASLGGAGAMWLTMILIGHKTRKKKFILGLPSLILLHLGLLYYIRTRMA